MNERAGISRLVERKDWETLGLCLALEWCGQPRVIRRRR